MEPVHRGRIDIGSREPGLAFMPLTEAGLDVRHLRANVFSVSTGLHIRQETSRTAGRGELSFPNAARQAGYGVTARKKVDAQRATS